MKSGKLIILCGPSGSGKTTIAHHLLEEISELSFSISATTRSKRPNEEHGRDYYFMSTEEFRERLNSDEFVEHEQVYENLYYGTLKSELERIWRDNRIPVLDIDVLGALNIKNNYAPDALVIFIHPVSLENIYQRLKKRATESAESFHKRVTRAEEELGLVDRFENVIYNDSLEKAMGQAEEYITNYLEDKKVKA